MLRWYYAHRIGDIYARCEDNKVRRCNIFGGNALCIMTQWFKDEKTGKTMERLLNFYNDEQHIKNIMKEYKKLEPVDDITAIRLNTYHKESLVLAKYFTLSGYKVTLYYKEPKKPKEKKKK